MYKKEEKNFEEEIREKLKQFINLRWKEKLKWFIDIRWIAVVSVFLTITFSPLLFKVKLHLKPLYLLNLILLIYNLMSFIYYKQIESEKETEEKFFKKANLFANIQISLDLIILTCLIHFSGGIENPFIFYFIFHMVIASILLSKKSAYIQATLAVILLGTMATSEYFGFIRHYHLKGFISNELYLNSKYLTGLFLIFISTLYVTVYFATFIVDRLREQEKELIIANKKLEEQDRLKSRYVLTVSHDIKSSLSAIKSCLEVVLKGLTGQISEKSREMVYRAERRTESILQFVRDLLDLSRIRATQKIEKKPILLSEIIRKIVKQLKQKAEEKGISLVFEDLEFDSLIYADPYAMEEMILNLLTNSIKYTPSRGKVTINCQPLTLNSKLSTLNYYIQISVEDTGIGISEEDLHRIFDDFYRAEDAKKIEKDGTGLGLSIVKQIVESHKGKIFVESKLGKGTKFTIILPRGEV